MVLKSKDNGQEMTAQKIQECYQREKPAGLLHQHPELPSPTEAEERVQALEGRLLPKRAERLRSVLAKRSVHVVFVFEQMVDPHNLSAALRSLDACSFQEAHMVQAGERLWVEQLPPDATLLDDTPNRSRSHSSKMPTSGITQGADRWLSLYWWRDMISAAAYLKKRGYQLLVGVTSSTESIPLPQLDISRPLALVFGNEHKGISSTARELAEGCFWIPMYGFVTSYNLSVSVAVTAYHMRQSFPQGPPPLDAVTRNQLHAAWLLRATGQHSSVSSPTAIQG